MNKISIFGSFPKKGEKHKPTEAMEMDDFLNAIKYGKWKNQVEPIRQEKNKQKRDQLKRSLPGVTISGTFSAREEQSLVEHSGFLCVDIDNFNDKTALIEDKYTYCVFRSVSGNGIAVIVKVNPEKHKESYRWLSHYYFATYGISVDQAPKNPASFRFVSYDPELVINHKSLKSKTKSTKPKKVHSLPIILGTEQIDELISNIHNSGKDITNSDYETYLKIGFALASGFGEQGREYFHAVCANSEKYDSQQCDKQFDRCVKGTKSGVSVGSFYWIAKENGFDIPKTDQRAVQVAAMGKKSGRTPEGVKMQLVQVNGMDPELAEKITNEVYQRDDIDLARVAKDPDQLINSLIEWMNQNFPVRVNAITRMIEERGNELKKERMNTIYLQARICFNSKEVTKDLIESIIFSDNTPEFNPITEYIDKNRHRNSTGNIDNIIKSIKTDTEMADVFIKKWLVSIVAAYDGNPVRSVLALVGGQTTGKTEWFRRLLPAKIKKYYSESKLDAGKDDEMLMCQKLIVMDDEMGGKSKQDERRFKELTSKNIFSLRAPYARYNEDFKRLAVLCGTSNDKNVINDPTGNTRILPVNVLSIDHELYNSVDKDELFLELLRLYESGFEWQLSREDLAGLKDVSENYEVMPFERELIQKFFKSGSSGGGYAEYLTSTEIKDYIETNTRQKIHSMRRFSIELTKVLGESKIKRVNGLTKRVYWVIRDNVTESRVNSETPENTDLPF